MNELSVESTYSAIDETLTINNSTQREKRLRTRRVSASDVHAFLSSHNVSEFYSLDITSTPRPGDFVIPVYIIIEIEAKNEKNYNICAASLFSVGYSTWKGRVMNLDVFHAEKHEKELMQGLVRIADSLDCARIVHQTKTEETAHFFRDKFGAEILPDWLTLKMGENEMKSFLRSRDEWGGEINNSVKSSLNAVSGNPGYNSDLSVKQVMDNALAYINTILPSSNIKLRRAISDDAGSIFNLVQGLAVYEKAAEEVSVNELIYKRDGGGANPIFHCILVESIREGGAPEVVGMGFFYFGVSVSNGKYLYLEDLFIEENFRGIGCGKSIMYCLAEISLQLGCHRFVWQALDWNTSALAFYEGIGAEVCNRLVTTRLNNDAIQNLLPTQRKRR